MKIAALVIAAALAAPAAAVTYDPHADFSTAANPNGAYTYGYEATLGGTLTNFTNGQAQSWTSPSVDQYLGVYNRSTTLLQHPGPAGQYSVLRITVATTGQYVVNGVYSNGDNASTDVHVLTNGVAAFNGAVNGASSSSSFGFTQLLAAGSTVDFAVGNGGNGDNNDSTLLSATVGSVPEPASWALLIAGFGLVGAVKRRQRGAVATNV